MTRSDLIEKIDQKNREIHALRQQQIELAKSEGLQEVENYTFKTPQGTDIQLVELFGPHDQLIVIHNMGKQCPYCTLWADGFSSMYPYLKTLSGFALTSPNDYQTLKEFGESRGWSYPYYSASESTFTADMGFSSPNPEGKTQYMPGYTTFLKKDGKIYHVACDVFGPDDFYAPIWHFKEMLSRPNDPWKPEFNL